jgi:hypothetical protein
MKGIKMKKESYINSFKSDLLEFVKEHGRAPFLYEDKKLYTQIQNTKKRIISGDLEIESIRKLNDVMPYMFINKQLKDNKRYVSPIDGKEYYGHDNYNVQELIKFNKINHKLPKVSDSHHFLILRSLRKMYNNGKLSEKFRKELDSNLPEQWNLALNEAILQDTVRELKHYIDEHQKLPNFNSKTGFTKYLKRLNKYRDAYQSGDLSKHKVDYLNREFPNWIYYTNNQDVEELMGYAKKNSNLEHWDEKHEKTLDAIYQSIFSNGIYKLSQEQVIQIVQDIPSKFNKISLETILLIHETISIIKYKDINDVIKSLNEVKLLYTNLSISDNKDDQNIASILKNSIRGI